MSEIISNFHFLRPWWLLALAALPLLWQALRRHDAAAESWRSAVDAHLLEHLLVRAGASGARAPLALVAAGWALACLALAGPTWERLPQPLFQNRAARVLALELAPSMLAQDLKPSRLDRARFKISDILKRSGDGQTALIAFAADAFVVAPMTDDVNTVANLVDALAPDVMPAAGNDTARAINLGVQLIHQAGLSAGEVVLIADAAGSGAVTAARAARAAGVSVSVLGIGTAQGAPVALPQGGFVKDAAGQIVLPKLDASALAALAQAGGGRYATFSADRGDLDALLDTLRPHAATDSVAVQAQSPRFLDRGPWLLLALLPLAAVGFRRGWLLLLPLVLLAHSNPSYAFSWTDLWQRPDQQARAQLDSGDAKAAQALAHDPNLRAAAAYRAGDYAAAVQDLANLEQTDALYNRGNALAKQGHYPEALAAYAAALKRAPDMDDASANKKAVEDWLNQRQKEQKQKSKNGSNQKQDAKDRQNLDQSGADQEQDQQQSGRQDQQDQQAQDSAANAAESAQQDSPQQSASAAEPADQQQSAAEKQNAATADSNERDDQGTQAEQKRAAAEADQLAQQQFEHSVDQALKQDDGKRKDPQVVRLGARESATPSEQQQALEQWLQRVPDDPGGLLRRKFQLESQRRQNGDREPEHPP